MNKTIKLASLVAGFILVIGVIFILSQNLIQRAGVSATFPLAGRTVAIPKYLWDNFQNQLEKLLLTVAQDKKYAASAEALKELLNQIKPLP